MTITCSHEKTLAEPLDIGLGLRKMRLKSGYSQQFVADIFNISRNAYIDWEKNKVNLTVQSCATVCQFYGIPLSEFVKTYLEK